MDGPFSCGNSKEARVMTANLKQIIPGRIGYLHVFLLGLAVRIVYLFQAWANNELIDFPIVDAEVYTNWANSILAGNFLWYEPSNYTPMYPFYLAFWLFLLRNTTMVVLFTFLLIGALQAVVIGRTAELLWDRRTGIVAALLAALYWPFIVIEATFYAENCALWTLSLGLLLLCQYNKNGKRRYLLLAGLTMAVACLCRVNAVLCLGAIACWLVLDAIRRRLGFITAVSRLLLLLLPMAAMSFPIMMWNLKLTGSPMLRTQGTECLYIGNEPDYGGLIVSPGWEWTNLETKPLHEGKTLAIERGRYWLDKTIEIVRTRPGAWLFLQGKKLLMQLGNYEVSQEIDTYRFKNSSSLLGCVLWPGFGFLFPLAVAGIVLAISRKESRAVPVWVCAAVYLISILPFQVASRFRLILVVPLLPFAAMFLVDVVNRIRSRQFRPLLAAGAGLLVAYAVVLPDYTGLAGRNIIDHWLFVGKKRMSSGDINGAINAYTTSAEELPGRVDSLLQMGYAHLWTNGVQQASASFTEARRRNESCAEAVLGLAGCDARSGKDDEAVELCREVLQWWPNSREALRLLQGIYFRQENWPMLELVLNQLRTYVNWPPDAAFQLARISVLQGNSSRAFELYEELAVAGHIGSFDRSRALLVAGILKWRTEGNLQGATALWRRSFEMGDKNISPLAACLLGELKPDELAAPEPRDSWKEAEMYRFYVLGISAWMRGDVTAAAGQFEWVVAPRHAEKLMQHEMSLLESWAVADLAKIRP